MKSSTQENAEGKMHQIKGKIKQVFGNLHESIMVGPVQPSTMVNKQQLKGGIPCR